MNLRASLARVGRTRSEPFARASEEPFRRRWTDAVRFVLALCLTIWLASDSGHSSDLAIAVFQAINGLPGDLRPVTDLLYDFSTLWSVALIAAAALWARRWRLARDLLLAGGLAWLTARGLGLVLADGFRHGLSVTFRSRASTDFPNVPLSVAMAVASTAAPYVTRALRWLGWSIALLLVPVEMYLGEAMPKSLGCALAVGVMAAAAVHFGLGSPAGRPTSVQVEAALRDIGVTAASGVHLAAVQPSEHTLMLATDGDAELMVKVLGRDERDAQTLVKLWRFLLYRDSGPPPFFTRLQDVEHQAYVMLLSQHAGVQVAPLVAAGRGGPGTVLLAERRLPGTILADLPAEKISDAVLVDAWVQVGQLHHIRVAHGRLTTRHVLVHDDSASLVGLTRSWASASGEQQARDTAELLATTSTLVGTQRAVAAALQGLGKRGLVDALPLLQPGALTRDARRVMGSDLNRHMSDLREAAAQAAEVPVPEPEQLRRISGPTAALTIGFLVAIGGLLSAVGDPATLVQLVQHARPGALGLSVALALASNIGFALALSGSTTHRLPLWANLKIQAAGGFSNIAFPLGSQALQIRFLQKQGVSGAAAVAGGGLINLAAGTAAQVGLLALALAASPATVDLGQIPTGAITLTLEIAVAATLAASMAVLVVPKLRHLVLPPVERGAHALVQVLRSPRQLALLLGGSALAYLLIGLALGATLHALHQSLPVSEVIAVSVGVTLIAAVVPLPGGGGAVSAVGLSGALVSLGVPQGAAVAAALLNQVMTSYVPALPGWLALRSLLKHGDL